MRPILYVCAPWRTRTPEESAETKAAIAAALAAGWCAVFAPYALERLLDDESQDDRRVALECALSLLSAASALLVVGERVTEGMALELERARALELARHAWPDVPVAGNARHAWRSST